MGYNPNIPLGTDPILQSQMQLLFNFQTIGQVFAANHFALNGNNNFLGMHTVLTMQPQSGDPSTKSSQVGLYTKLDSNNVPELFYAPNSSQIPIQLTYPSINTDFQEAQQYTFMAGPFIIYGGKITNPGNGQVITLSPSSNLLYVGTTTANYKLGNILQAGTTVPTNINSPMSTFTINFSTTVGSTKRDVYYLAIGQ